MGTAGITAIITAIGSIIVVILKAWVGPSATKGNDKMKYSKGARILWTATLMLSLLVSTGCVRRPVVIVAPESRTEKIRAGDEAPFDGWLLTNSAVMELLELSEAGEKCQGQK